MNIVALRKSARTLLNAVRWMFRQADHPDALAEAMDGALFNPTETVRKVRLSWRRITTLSSGSTTYIAYEATWYGDA